jgi:NAD(P)-dependent dehydrogenase (short-subunit alcohol dehydrogenase family)
MSQTVLITGASSGIGRAAANLFSKKGWNVIAAMRDPQAGKDLTDSPQIFVTDLDVQKPESIARTVEAGLQRFGKIDALVNNAGFGLCGVFESISPEKIREQFDVNLFGVMETTRALLPHFRQNQAGMILNIGSRGGVIGLPLMSLYCASKFALEGFSESLAYELASQKIIVKIIAPAGGVPSRFGIRLQVEMKNNRFLADYEKFTADIARARDQFSKEREGMAASADEIAELIYLAATDGTDRLRYEGGHDIPPFLRAKREMADQDYINFMKSSHGIGF